MKYVKMLGLAAVAAMALTAFLGAGTASADQFCTETKKTGEECPAGKVITTIEGTLKSGTTAILETTGGTVLDTCAGSDLEGPIESQGPGKDISGPIATLHWTNCTKTTTTLKPGKLTLQAISGTHNGILTGSGSEVTINGVFGESCIYGTGTGTNLGTAVGGKPATIAINTIVPLISGGGFCPSHARWTASYQLTNHSAGYVIAN
jgi:hypothetical protein